MRTNYYYYEYYQYQYYYDGYIERFSLIQIKPVKFGCFSYRLKPIIRKKNFKPKLRKVQYRHLIDSDKKLNKIDKKPFIKTFFKIFIYFLLLDN